MTLHARAVLVCRVPRASGFTYIGLLIAVVILGLTLSMVGTLWRTQAQRERERELLFIGHEFRAAIASYYRAGAGGNRYPQELADLLEDKRFPEPRHHLRRLYADPMTGTTDWTIVRIDAVGITGIASTSQAEPLKRAGFDDDDAAFADTQCYCDWRFVYIPRNIRRRATVVPDVTD